MLKKGEYSNECANKSDEISKASLLETLIASISYEVEEVRTLRKEIEKGLDRIDVGDPYSSKGSISPEVPIQSLTDRLTYIYDKLQTERHALTDLVNKFNQLV